MPVSFDLAPATQYRFPHVRQQTVEILRTTKGVRADASGGSVYRQCKGGHDFFAKVFGQPLFVISEMYEAGWATRIGGCSRSQLWAIDVKYSGMFFRICFEDGNRGPGSAYGYRATAIDKIAKPIVAPLSQRRRQAPPVGPNPSSVRAVQPVPQAQVRNDNNTAFYAVDDQEPVYSNDSGESSEEPIYSNEEVIYSNEEVIYSNA